MCHMHVLSIVRTTMKQNVNLGQGHGIFLTRLRHITDNNNSQTIIMTRIVIVMMARHTKWADLSGGHLCRIIGHYTFEVRPRVLSKVACAI